MSGLDKNTAAISAGEIAYADEGEGRPILFLHGIPSSSHLFRNVAPLLAPSARVLIPDLLGYGDSAKPEGADLTVLAQTGYVRELLDGLGIDRCAVVGHDLGTGIAQLLALEGRVEAAVLTDGITFDGWPVHAVQMLRDMPPEQRGEAAALGRAFRAVDGEGLVDAEEGLRRLDIPVFILWGEEDPFQGPENAERLGEVIPTATIALLPGVSHFLTEDAPETVGPLIAQWLRSAYLGEGHRPESATIDPEELGVSFERPGEPPDLPDEGA
jgi:pimeloyl-ACP methyl ester carboxylesterase